MSLKLPYSLFGKKLKIFPWVWKHSLTSTIYSSHFMSNTFRRLSHSSLSRSSCLLRHRSSVLFSRNVAMSRSYWPCTCYDILVVIVTNICHSDKLCVVIVTSLVLRGNHVYGEMDFNQYVYELDIWGLKEFSLFWQFLFIISQLRRTFR